jgi:hypothetical protein
LAAADISFSGGAMWFFDVRVDAGELPESALQHPALD